MIHEPYLKSELVVKLASFFVVCFYSLSLLFVGLDRAQNTMTIPDCTHWMKALLNCDLKPPAVFHSAWKF